MSKHNIGDKVVHSRYGEGSITAVTQEMETPKAYDPVKLDGELWNLRARIAEIEAIMARGMEPRPVDKYMVKFDGGRAMDFTELGIDKLKSRV